MTVSSNDIANVSACAWQNTDKQSIWRYDRANGIQVCRDTLAGESPLEIRVRGKAVCITMRTPSAQDHEIAAGFLLSEGVIREANDVDRIETCARSADGNVVNVYLAPHVEYNHEQLTRHVFASSSCGICGKASIDAILCDFEPIVLCGHGHATIEPSVLSALPTRLREQQLVFNQTGGLHAAAVFTMTGELLAAREDVGRHNAVDKVLGHLLMQQRLPLDEHVLMVSGRVSFEIMQKALAGRIPIVAAVSAPSSLAVEFAQDSGQTLAGFVRDGRFNLYAHPQRIGITSEPRSSEA